MERLEFDLLFRRCVGLRMADPVWDASVFSKNRDRLLAGEVAQRVSRGTAGAPPLRRIEPADAATEIRTCWKRGIGWGTWTRPCAV